MKSIEDRIAELEAKLKQEKAKKQQIEARKRAIETKKQRSEDTRRKVLIGATIQNLIKAGEWSEERLRAMLDPALTRPDDRALFGLPPKTETTPPPKSETKPKAAQDKPQDSA